MEGGDGTTRALVIRRHRIPVGQARSPQRIGVRAAPRCLTWYCSEMALNPRCRDFICVASRNNLFTVEVRLVIAGMENSFLNLAFIYTLIKMPFTQVVRNGIVAVGALGGW